MRVLFAIALLFFGIAGVTAAGAADFAIDNSGGKLFPAYGHRAGQLVIYDYQPGVVVRAYWRAPWRHRHYFPATGKQPRIGRVENLSAPSDALEPAKTFRRNWSNSSAFCRKRRAPAHYDRHHDPRPAP